MYLNIKIHVMINESINKFDSISTNARNYLFFNYIIYMCSHCVPIII